jgi:hypothetical protein
MTVWSRRILVPAPAGAPAVRCVAGRRWPTQTDEAGAWAMIEAHPGVSPDVVADTTPAAATWWEVDPQILDNGVVRAEFSADCGITRLCWDGRFADLAGPIAAGMPDLCVHARGPVRARLGTATDGWELRAGDAWLTGYRSAAGVLRIPTRHAGPLRAAGTGAGFLVPPGGRATDVRWVAVGHDLDPADEGAGLASGCAVAADRPIAADWADGVLTLRHDGPVRWAIAHPSAHLTRLAMDLASGDALPAGGPRLRWADADGLWITPVPGGATWQDQHDRRRRAVLFGPGVVRDGRGAPLPQTPEGDGWVLNIPPRGQGILQWD